MLNLPLGVMDYAVAAGNGDWNTVTEMTAATLAGVAVGVGANRYFAPGSMKAAPRSLAPLPDVNLWEMLDGKSPSLIPILETIYTNKKFDTRALVPVSPHLEVPYDGLPYLRTYMPSYERFAKTLKEAPMLDSSVKGPHISNGSYNDVFTFMPDRRWLFKTSRDGYNYETPGAAVELALEAASLKRLQMIDVPVPEVPGMLKIQHEYFGKGTNQTNPPRVVLGILEEEIPNAMDLRRLARAGQLNVGFQLDFWHEAPTQYKSMFNRNSIYDMDASINAQLSRGFVIGDQQSLIDKATGRVYEFDPKRLEPWSDLAGSKLEKQIYFRNQVADLVGVRQMSMDVPANVPFRQWWDGEFVGHQSILESRFGWLGGWNGKSR